MRKNILFQRLKRASITIVLALFVLGYIFSASEKPGTGPRTKNPTTRKILAAASALFLGISGFLGGRQFPKEQIQPPPDQVQTLQNRAERVVQIEAWNKSDPRLKNQERYGEHIEMVKVWIHEDPGLIEDIAALGLQEYIPDTLE